MKKWTIVLTVLMAAALLAGCEPNTRYKVLSFFFDGVPNPEDIKAAEMKKKADEERKARGGTGVKTAYKHGPYAAKMCEGCHVKGGSNRLVAPLDQLCYTCHQFITDKKWVHGPFAAGDCTVCHDPHSSKYKFLLTSEPARLCFNCHDEKAITESEMHKGTDMQCVSCHDPHLSDQQYMLK